MFWNQYLQVLLNGDFLQSLKDLLRATNLYLPDNALLVPLSRKDIVYLAIKISLYTP